MSTDLSNIRHISLDFWNTLATPNPEYAFMRTNLIASYFDIPFDEAKRLYTSTKKFMDTAAEMAGFALSREDVVQMLNKQMPSGHSISQTKLNEFTFKMDQLFQHNIPTISQELVEVLKLVKARGVQLGVLSNTNFTRGALLRGVVLDPAFGDDFFAVTMFSDEWKMAKPSGVFYRHMISGARRARAPTIPLLNQIIHIGDNLITDVKGAQNVGIEGLHVTDPTDLVRLLQGMLE